MQALIKSTQTSARAALALSVLAGTGLLGGSAARAVNVYDSQGFESSAGFQDGFTLEGQTGGTPRLTFQSRVGTTPQQVAVRNLFGVSGSFGVDVEYGTAIVDGGEPVYTNNFTTVVAPVDTSVNPFVIVSSDLFVRQATANTTTPGTNAPIFGLNASANGGSTSTNPDTVGAAYLDSGTGELSYQTSVGGTPQLLPSNMFYALDVYHNLTLQLNYTTGNYDILVDGKFVLPAPVPFATPSTTYSNTDLVGANNVPGQTFSAGGYFDNYSITAIPEPASLGLIALAGLACTRRRRAVR